MMHEDTARLATLRGINEILQSTLLRERRKTERKRRRAAHLVADLKRDLAARDDLIRLIATAPRCFADCLHAARCEHQEPNLCGVAAPCQCWPFGPEDCEECGGRGWHYPTADAPNTGYPDVPRLRFTDLSEEQMRNWIDWRSGRVSQEREEVEK